MFRPFVGQIDFILTFSGIKEFYRTKNSLDWEKKTNAQYVALFYEYAEKSAFMFSDNGLNEFDDYLWQ